MSTLLRKEIRLVLPAYAVALALALAVAPIGLFASFHRGRLGEASVLAFWAVVALWFGAVLLALTSFGKEFSLNTFSLLMAQPLERARLWRTKVGVLGIGMATLLAVWTLSLGAALLPGTERSAWGEVARMGVVTVVVSFAGGLWTTLAFRQVAAAFWFTALLPGAILALITLAGGTERSVCIALLAYSVAGFWLAWWQFHRVQATAWTGGIVALAARPTAAAAAGGVRSRRPLRALFWKELRSYQLGLAGVAALFLLHLGVVAIRKGAAHTLPDSLRGVLDMFGGIWLIVPLVLAGPSVAEERQLGTLDLLACLPASRRRQFAIKLFFALALGGLLSAGLLWIAESGSTALGVATGFGEVRASFDDLPSLMTFELTFLTLAVIGFYASTLARHTVHALALGVVVTLGVWLTIPLGWRPVQVFGVWLWGSTLRANSLLYYVGLPGLAVGFLWLSWRNFRPASRLGQLWRRNALGLAITAAAIVAVTALVFNRVWELVTPLEPAHEPARIAAPDKLRLSSPDNNVLVALMPDRTLWVDRITYNAGRPFFALGPGGRFDFGGRWSSRGGRWSSLDTNRFAEGTNWIAAAATFRETIAIKSDGSLWVSPSPRRFTDYWRSRRTAPPELVRVGQETNWQSVADSSDTSVLLLKTDGTLWIWGTNSFADPAAWPGFRAAEPRRLGTDSDWGRIQSLGGTMRQGELTYLWKADGSAWVWLPWVRRRGGGAPEPGTFISRLRGMDNRSWRSLGQAFYFQFGVREDGTLWAWRLRGEPGAGLVADMTQLGKDSDWRTVAGEDAMMVALKADGSLWKWEASCQDGRFELPVKPPTRLGSHRDWVALSRFGGGAVSLAADGSLWFWRPREPDQQYLGGPVLSFSGQPLLSASRRPVRIENLFDPPN